MKTLFITIFALISLSAPVETETITAVYDGMEEGTYYFTDEDELVHSFDMVTDGVLTTYDLDSDAFHGKKFKVTYNTMTEINEDDEEYDMHVITKLELIK
ncbi:hypothetical protein EAX61_05230 [Dokdonia sinensis]|uniref:Uncharacterized protein n=1 Tax=Dokdonia sinensis TaxID=2479847 RepID=A0A3M0G901_9FLAO|nr:hypothetical protein [Dokdonia sinensis]RMB60888.1 hypothetical protein EAX61_05230 [Dokdonia sinensis]